MRGYINLWPNERFPKHLYWSRGNKGHNLVCANYFSIMAWTHGCICSLLCCWFLATGLPQPWEVSCAAQGHRGTWVSCVSDSRYRWLSLAVYTDSLYPAHEIVTKNLSMSHNDKLDADDMYPWGGTGRVSKGSLWPVFTMEVHGRVDGPGLALIARVESFEPVLCVLSLSWLLTPEGVLQRTKERAQGPVHILP